MASKTRILKHRNPPSFGRCRSPSLRSHSRPRRITVGSLAWGIHANAENFTKGVVATKAELRDLKSAFIASQTPVEKFSTNIAHLEALAAKFPDKAGPLKTQIAGIRAEMARATTTSSAFSKAFGSIVPTIDLGNIAMRGAHAAFALFRKGLDTVIDRIGELRAMSKKASGMGMSLGDMVGLSEAAESLSGVGADQFQGALGKFGAGIGTAAMTGKGTAADALKRLGLDAGELSGMGVKDQLLAVADAMDKIENVNERMALSKGILGKGGEELAEMLAAGGDAIRRIAEEGERAAGIEFISVDKIEEAFQAMDQLGDTLTGVSNVAASEFAPAMTTISGELNSMIQPGGELREIISGLAHFTQLWASGLEETLNLLLQIQKFAPGGSASSGAEFASGLMRVKSPEGTPGEWVGVGGAPDAEKVAIQKNIDEKAQAAAEKAAVALRKSTESRLSDFEKMNKLIVDGTEYEAKLAQTAQDKLIKKKWDALNDWAELEAKTYKHNDDKATKIIDAQKNGAEKLRDDFEEINDLHAKGFLTDEQRAEALTDLRSKARDMSLTDSGPRTVGAMRGGSVEALRQEFSGKNNTEKQLEAQKKIEENTRQAADLLRELNTALTGQLAEAT